VDIVSYHHSGILRRLLYYYITDDDEDDNDDKNKELRGGMGKNCEKIIKNKTQYIPSNRTSFRRD